MRQNIVLALYSWNGPYTNESEKFSKMKTFYIIALYRKRMKIVPYFFQFCNKKSVKEHEMAFTYLSQSKMIRNKHVLSCSYGEKNYLQKLFKGQLN